MGKNLFEIPERPNENEITNVVFNNNNNNNNIGCGMRDQGGLKIQRTHGNGGLFGKKLDSSGSIDSKDSLEEDIPINLPSERMKDEKDCFTPPKTPTKDHAHFVELGGNSTTAKKDAKARFHNLFSDSTDG